MHPDWTGSRSKKRPSSNGSTRRRRLTTTENRHGSSRANRPLSVKNAGWNYTPGKCKQRGAEIALRRSTAKRFMSDLRSRANPNDRYRHRQTRSQGSGNGQCKCNDQIFLSARVVYRLSLTPRWDKSKFAITVTNDGLIPLTKFQKAGCDLARGIVN